MRAMASVVIGEGYAMWTSWNLRLAWPSKRLRRWSHFRRDDGNRHRHRPEECRGTVLDAASDVPPPGLASKRTTRLERSHLPQAGRHAHRFIVFQFSSCRCLGPAPEPACRRHATSLRPAHADAKHRPEARADRLRPTGCCWARQRDGASNPAATFRTGRSKSFWAIR